MLCQGVRLRPVEGRIDIAAAGQHQAAEALQSPALSRGDRGRIQSRGAHRVNVRAQLVLTQKAHSDSHDFQGDLVTGIA
jgi:hypothetical protein